jgi:hypothetical protein
VTVSDHRDLVSALLAVPGVSAAAVEPVGTGPGTLRLQLAKGADEVDVAGAVNRLLRSRFGLAVDVGRVRVVEDAAGVRSATAGTTTTAPRPGPAGNGTTNGNGTATGNGTNGKGGADRNGSASATVDAPPAAPPGDGGEPGAPEGRDDGEPGAPEGADAAPTGDRQEAERALPDVTVTRPGRLVIERVQLVSAGLGTSVSVSLGLDGRTVEGSAEGTASTGSLLRSVANATLRAVEQVVGGEARFDVEHVEVATTGPDRTALAVVTMVTGRATQRLSGASVVREDVRQAVIRAVLAAVNRRLEPMLADREDQAG